MKPLDGVKVIDLTHMLAGPYAGMVIADLGAEVVKVEPLDTGEMTRGLLKNDPDYSFKDFGAYFLTLNRNKKSVSIDLKTNEGLNVFYDLVKSADVVLNNFSAGVVSKLKIDFEQLSKINPKIIYCSITGFGQNGPYAKRGGYDYLVQAMGGIMSITGEKKGNPTKIGVGVSDIITGLYASNAILAALRFRDKTSEGQHLDLSLMDSQVSWLSYVAQSYLISKEIPKRIGNDHPSIVPYQTVLAKDGLMVLAIANDRQFRDFCKFAKIRELFDNPKFSTNSLRVKNRNSLNKTILKVLKEKKID